MIFTLLRQELHVNTRHPTFFGKLQISRHPAKCPNLRESTEAAVLELSTSENYCNKTRCRLIRSCYPLQLVLTLDSLIP